MQSGHGRSLSVGLDLHAELGKKPWGRSTIQLEWRHSRPSRCAISFPAHTIDDNRIVIADTDSRAWLRGTTALTPAERGESLDRYPGIASRVIGEDIMTDPAESPESKASSTEIQLTFRGGVTQADRQNAEYSVAALVERSTAAVLQRRAVETELAEMTGSLNRSLGNLIGEDLHANKGFENLSAQQVVQPEAMDALGHGALAADGVPYSPQDLATVRSGSVGFVPPYDFQWAWHDPAGSPQFSMIQNRSSGALGLDARSGALPGGASGFVNVHAGFGVFLHSDVTAQRYPHAVLNPGRFKFGLGAVGVGADATSEGGFELTVFEDGRFLTGASRKLWRSRVSSSIFHLDESSFGGQENHLITGPELEFTIRPDHGYTFNAGIWAYSDRSTGAGAAAVQSLLQGILTRMWVFG